MKKLKSEIYTSFSSPIRIENSDAWKTWMQSLLVDDNSRYIDVMLNSDLYGYNKERFKKMWGQQSFCWKSWVRNWVWVHQLEHGNLFILTASNGTLYEVGHNKTSTFEQVATDAVRFMVSSGLFAKVKTCNLPNI